ncbi:MAG: hypothetical protein ACRCXZ_08860 [Patescibacteria group bacterium]
MKPTLIFPALIAAILNLGLSFGTHTQPAFAGGGTNATIVQQNMKKFNELPSSPSKDFFSIVILVVTLGGIVFLVMIFVDDMIS